MRWTCTYLSAAASLLLASSAVCEESLTVDMDFVPSAYSVERVRFEQLLSMNPSVRLRSYRRLAFASRSDELAYSLKTGNAPDVMSLGISEYKRLADAGQLLDLSPTLLRPPGGPVRGIEYGWTPMRGAGQPMKDLLLRNGRIYGFPGRRRVHGAVLRRSALLGTALPERLTAAGLARLSSELSRHRGGPSAALALDPELLAYWSIAEFAESWKNMLQGGEQVSKAGAATRSLEGVALSFSSILHGSVLFCDACGRAGLSDSMGAPAYECAACGADGGRFTTAGAPGLETISTDDAMRLFVEGKVDIAVCTRGDLYSLIDSGMSPSEFIFLPVAGAEHVGDVEVLCIYARVPQRPGGADRTDMLVSFLKEYCAQFLTEEDSPLYLWYERALIGLLLRRGYGDLFSERELALCQDVYAAVLDPAPTGDELADFDGRVITLDQFVEMASLSGIRALEGLVAGIRDGRLSMEGYAASLDRSGRVLIGGTKARLIMLALLAILLVFAYKLVTVPAWSRQFRACLRPSWRIAAVLVLFCAVPPLFRLSFTVVGACLDAARVVTVNVPQAASSASAVMALVSIVISTVFEVLVAVALSVALSVFAAALLARMKGWRVVVSFFIASAACLAGFWGVLLLDGVRDWLFDGMNPVRPEHAQLGVRTLAIAFATLPFACMAYVYRLTRIDPALYDAVSIDGGTGSERFFAVTWPALEGPVVLHASIVAVAVLTGVAGGLLGHTEPALGGSLLRTFLFSESPELLAVLNITTVLCVLLVLAFALRRLKGLEVRKTYAGSSL